MFFLNFQVKHFFLAIYNVSVVGGAMYFFSLYGATTVGAFVALRCVGIFVSATLPVLIIMIPKFTVIQYKNITGKNLWANSKSKGVNSSGSTGGVVSDKRENKLMFDLKMIPIVQVIPVNHSSSCSTPAELNNIYSVNNMMNRNKNCGISSSDDQPSEMVKSLVERLTEIKETKENNDKIDMTGMTTENASQQTSKD